MPLVQILIVLVVVGVLLWLVNSYIPMQGTIKSILNAVVIIAVVLWLLTCLDFFIPSPTSTLAIERPRSTRAEMILMR